MILSGIVFNTFRDCVRQPLYFIMLAFTISLIGLYPLLSFFVFNEQIKMVLDSSMASTLLFAMILSVLLSGSSIYKDIASGNISLILSKPISRNIFLAGRVIGVILAVSQFVIVCSLSSVVSIYIAVNQFNLDYKIFYTFYTLILAGCFIGFIMNYFFRKSFSENSGRGIALLILVQVVYLVTKNPGFLNDSGLPIMSLLSLSLLLLFAIWMTVSISIVISTRFDLVVNLIVCFSFLVLGLLSDYLVGAYASGGSYIFSVIYAILPNWQFFWLVDAVNDGKNIPLNYIGYSLLYTLLYTGLCFTVAAISFGSLEAAKANKE